MKHQSRGFTLIELMVVVAIIGLLSSVVLASLNTARSKGNDAARMQNVKALGTAMELYYSDNNSYPKNGTVNTATTIGSLSTYLAPKDISVIPQNLINDNDQYTWGSANSYAFYIYTEMNGWCKTGVNMTATWWSSAHACNS